MYCRKCGSKINSNAKFCDRCGQSVVVVNQMQNNQENKSRKKVVKEKNPYVIPAMMFAILAFALAIFPYPHHWQIGTSLWLRIIILVLALLADYHSTKARQVNNLYLLKYKYKVKPEMISVATVLGTVTTVVALYSLFMI